jgi:hypothetical protein
MRRVVIAMALMALTTGVAPPAGAQPKARAGKKAQAKVLTVGTEVSVFLTGGEAIGKPNVAKAGVAGPDWLVVTVCPAPDLMGHEIRMRYYVDSHNRLIDATRAGDKAGVDGLIAEGRAVRLAAGTRLIVTLVQRYSDAAECQARVVAGEHAGKVVEIPIRNLR